MKITQAIFIYFNWICFDRNYIIRRRTMAAKIPYYVSRDFSANLKHYYKSSLGKLEKDVKNEYKTKLAQACNREKKQSKSFWIAKPSIFLKIKQVVTYAITQLFAEKFYLKAAENSFKVYIKQQLYEQAELMKTPSCVKLEWLNETLNQSNSYIVNIFYSVVKYLHSWILVGYHWNQWFRILYVIW